MKNYLKLVNFEVNRFFKIYVVLVILTAASQCIGSIVVARRYMKDATLHMNQNMMSMNEFATRYGKMSFVQVVQSDWFVLPIMFCIAALMIYVFFIWYRDWIGKNTFAYRLLTLPIERITIYFAKLKAMMLFVLGLLAIQIVLILIEKQIVQMVVPNDLYSDFPMQLILHQNMLSILYPASLTEFVVLYGIGLTLVSVIYTGILLERSYRWKGIIFAVLYGAVAFFVFSAPILVNSFLWIDYFYQIEILWMMLGLTVVIFVSSIWTAHYLLKYKIKV